MAKKLKLVIGKWGYELTMHKFTPEQYKKITNHSIENCITLEEVFLYELSEILDVGNDWYDFDSLGHYYGPSLPDCKLFVFEDGNTIPREYDISHVETEEVISKIENDDTNIFVTYVSSEKGNLKILELELEETNFDINKLKLELNVILTPNNVYELINEVSYGGKILYGDNGDTTGKGLTCEIKLPLKIIEKEKKLVINTIKDLEEKEKWAEGEGPQTD